MQAVSVPVIFSCETGNQLGGALRVAHVVDFVFTSLVYDLLNVSLSVILHIKPGEVPVLLSGWASRVIFCMSLAVLGASAVSDPNGVALVDKLELESFSVFLILDPRCSIIFISMLDQNFALVVVRMFADWYVERG